MNSHRVRRTTTALSIVAALALTSCGADRDSGTAPDDARDLGSTAAQDESSTTEATSPTPSPSGSSGPRPDPVAYTLRTKSHTVHVRLNAPDRFRPDGRIPERLHFLPLNVVTDDEAERWGDFFLYAPTRVHDPSSQELVPAPDDLASWLSANPTVRVLSTRTYAINGRAARELNVERDGSLIFPGDEPGPAGGLERYVLWRIDGVWLVGQASTFRGVRGITAPSGRRDPFTSLLSSARLVRR
jgi:hypothetical protein